MFQKFSSLGYLVGAVPVPWAVRFGLEGLAWSGIFSRHGSSLGSRNLTSDDLSGVPNHAAA